jgi:hypothetical protein
MRTFIPIALFLLLPGLAFAQGKSFEDLAKTANPTSDMEKVVGPFLQQCGAGNELPDLHCRAIRQYMQHKISTQVFTTTVGGGALLFDNYDSVKFVYPVTLNGCLTCSKPLEFDPVLFAPNNKFFITTKQPTKLEGNVPQGIDLGKFEISVDPRDLGKWTKGVQPFLQVQFLYRVVAEKVWDAKLGAGITLHTGGYRVFNRCTGEVLFSSPPSSAPGPVDKRGCPDAGDKPVVEDPSKSLPEKLAPSQILEVMKGLRDKADACYQQYQIPGVAEVSVTVTGKTGAVSGVKLRGAFADTPTGKCVADAITAAKFPMFRNESLTFSYKYDLK